MRDGVRLHTVILVPRGAQGAPILLTRTPYNATDLTSHAQSAHLGPILSGYDNATEVIVEGGYIRVVQDVRGKYGSEGDYVMNRPLHGPQNPTPVDHSTDTYDTIDWLVKNVPESNGRVGILGISYDGFLPLMALVNPHPALKVAVPMNPMVDGWMGDDWFHNGAFRQQMMAYVHDQEATAKSEAKWWTSHFDDYDMFMAAGSAGELGRRRGLEQLGFWRKILEHPAYDAFWRDQALDRILGAQPLAVPVMLVHSPGTRRTSTARPPSTGRWSRRTAATTRSSSSSAPGITARRSPREARSARSGSTATPRSISAVRSCARSSINT
jgi:putative CocE/NonD family hydrolase